MITQQGIQFLEGELLVKTLGEAGEMREAYQLRHKVFAEHLQWVPQSSDGLEIDPYDSLATSVGLFDEGRVLRGLFRLLPAAGPFMLEKEFRAFLPPDYEFRKEGDTNEITRLTIDPRLQEKGLSLRMLLVLLKGLYQCLVGEGVRYSYMVVEKRFLRVLRSIGFPCRPISPAMAFPPAEALSLAAILDWDEFREENARKRPQFFRWMCDVNCAAAPANGGGLWVERPEVSPAFASNAGAGHGVGSRMPLRPMDGVAPQLVT